MKTVELNSHMTDFLMLQNSVKNAVPRAYRNEVEKKNSCESLE